ncbi:hypothetical protein C942_02539 [Photobacterium marinum]|uniref:Uncharacterized protein n=1 Tax=Photobacterium marinum TaxID=1056511 RepID=L8J893_9GAMM|nr:hypothetical protein [Photobacterium marinum]ELR64408.1 hypothetical protein C942_02539 [Photobacterium marinum]
MAKLNHTEKLILQFLKEDFSTKNLGANSLSDGYDGPSMELIQQGTGTDKVDLDIAIESLEKQRLIKTGPTRVVGDNNPTPAVIMIPFIVSDKEYAYLTKQGYTSAKEIEVTRPKSTYRPQNQTIIYGGKFTNSPIASGSSVNQQQQINTSNGSDETVQSLLNLIKDDGVTVTSKKEKEITELVQAAESGDSLKSKNIFQKAFDSVSDNVQKVGWQIVTKLIMQQLEQP